MTKILTILGFLLFGLTNPTATACSCIGESTVEGGYENADIVVSGQVSDTENIWLPDSARIKEMIKLGFPADSLDKRLSGYYLTKVLININSIYKGHATKDTLTIYTGVGGGDCGFQFKEGQEYIIYGVTKGYLRASIKKQDFPNGHDKKVYWTNICKRTQEHNRKEIRKLEKIKNGS